MTTTAPIHAYTIHPVGPDLAWDVVYNHANPDYEADIFSETTYTFNASNYDHDGDKLLIGNINEALMVGVQSWLMPWLFEETTFPVVVPETLSQEIGDPDLSPYEIGGQGEELPKNITSSIFIGEDPYLGPNAEAFSNTNVSLEALDQPLLEGSTISLGCADTLPVNSSGILLDLETNTWSFGMTAAEYLTITYLFKGIRVIPDPANNPTLGVTLDVATVSGVKEDPDAEELQFTSHGWSMHNAYSYTDYGDLMEVLKDDPGEIPGTAIITLDSEIAILPLGTSESRQAYRADIMHTSEGDFINDWVGNSEPTQGSTASLPNLDSYTFTGEAASDSESGGSSAVIVLPPNIIIQ